MHSDETLARNEVGSIPRGVLIGGRVFCAFGVTFALFVALFAVVQIAAAGPAAIMPASRQDSPVMTVMTPTVRRDIVLLLDNSRSMVEDYDAGDKRNGFARFLVRLLQTFAREGSSVGVLRFAAAVSNTLPSGVETLVDLSLVGLWSRGDFQAIRPGECPRPGQADYRVAGRDPCYGTRFAAAFREAGNALKDCAKSGAASQCAILMFTDGDLRDPGNVVDSPEEIGRALRELPDGVKVYVLFFGEEGATAPASSAVWKGWKEPDGRISDWFFNAAEAERDEVYNAALRMLGMEDVLVGLRSVRLPATETAVDSLPLNVDRLELDVLPDVEITEAFTASWRSDPTGGPVAVKTEPDVNEGTRRIWLAPSFDALAMSLAARDGVAYYKVVTHTVPVQARVTVWPTEVVVGQPVQVQALISAGGRVLSDSNKVNVRARLEGTSQLPITLTVQPDGFWTGTLTANQAGHYTVEVQTYPTPASGRSTFVGLHVLDMPYRQILLRVMPHVQLVERPVRFEVWPLVGGTRADLPPDALVTVSLEPGGQTYRLHKEPDGSWRTTERIVTAQDYKAIVTVGLPEWANASQNSQPVHVLPVPELTVTTSPTEAPTGQKIDVLMIVTASMEMTPTLWQYSGTNWEPIPVQRQSPRHFQGQAIIPESRHLVMMARLPSLETNGWVLSQSEAYLITVRNTSLPEGIPGMVRFLLERLAPWLLLLVFTVIVTILFSVWWTRPERILIPGLILKTSGPEWDRLDTMSARKGWREVKALARYITEKIEHDGKLP